MGLLEQFAAEEDEAPAEVSTAGFAAMLSVDLTRATVSNEEMRQLKQTMLRFRKEIEEKTFISNVENLRIITAWFRASREQSFTALKPVKEKKVRVAKEPKEKKPSKKQLAEQEKAAKQLRFEDLI
jgi:hypothetical protein